MDLTVTMLEHLATAQNIVEKGAELVPAWRVVTPDGTFLILTRFDHNKPEQLERLISLMSRFMTWKMAFGYVLTVETWLGSEITRSHEEALLVVGVRRGERAALMQRISRADAKVNFGAVQWLMPEQVDETYFRLLQPATASLTGDEIADLETTFGRDGELEAQLLS